MRLEAVTVPGHGLPNETPFRPLAEALDPYRAENRCALNSLDTDRSTTLSPETVTANGVPAAEIKNISAHHTMTREIFTVMSGGRKYQDFVYSAAQRSALCSRPALRFYPVSDPSRRSRAR